MFCFTLIKRFRINTTMYLNLYNILIIILMTSIISLIYQFPVPAQTPSQEQSQSPAQTPPSSQNQAQQPAQTQAPTQAPAQAPTPAQPQVPTVNNFGFDLFQIPQLSSLQTGVTARPDYPLGPGDVLNIELWGDVSEQYSLKISKDGYIEIPNVSRIYIHGMSFEAAQDLIAFRLGTVYSSIDPAHPLQGTTKVSVNFGSIMSIWITVVGEVNKPGNIFVENTQATVFNILQMAGGPTDNASLRNVTVRHLIGKQDKIDLYRLFLEGNLPTELMYLKAGEIVFVPICKFKVEVKGAVRRPGIYELIETDVLKDLIRMAGDLTPNARVDNIQIERHTTEGGYQIIDLDLSKENNSLMEKFQLKDGDVIIIQDQPRLKIRQEVYIAGAGVKSPGRYQFEPGMTIKQLVDKAGLYPDVYHERADLFQRGQDFSAKWIQVDLRKALTQESYNSYKLFPMDSLVVYSKIVRKGGEANITLTGHLKYPGQYTLRESQTLYDLLLIAGGFSDPEFLRTTYLKRADLIQHDEITQEVYIIPFNLENLLNGDMNENKTLKTGDIVRVYGYNELIDRKYVTIQGAVHRSGRYELKDNMILNDLLIEANGLLLDADSSRVEISRKKKGGNPSEKIEIELLVKDIRRPEGMKYYLDHDDYVFVRRLPVAQKQRIIKISGEVVTPGEYMLIDNDEKLVSVINRTGGILESGFIEGTTLYRSSNNVGSVQIDLGKALANPKGPENIVLMDGDSITIPEKNFIIKVSGEVFRPRTVPFFPDKKAGYYIDIVGGYTPDADQSNVRILLPNGRVDRTRRLWFDHAIQPGSEIYVPKKQVKTSQTPIQTQPQK